MGITDLGFLLDDRYLALDGYAQECYVDRVVGEMDAEIKRLRPHMVKVILPHFKDIRPFLNRGYRIGVDYNYILDLQPSIDVLWDNLFKDCRTQIRNCEKYKLVLKKVDDVDTFYRIMTNRFKDDDAYFHANGPEYMREILEKFPDNAKLYFLYRNDEIVSVCLTCEFKNDVTLTWGYASKVHEGLNCNEYLIWELIKMAKAGGYKTMVNPDADTKRLTSFKSKFDGTIEYKFNIQKEGMTSRMAGYAYSNVLKNQYINKIVNNVIRS
jgi:lipid II:glycine glycyltransferase (peptidoglycan interpeptide bridge formation enzyme)